MGVAAVVGQQYGRSDAAPPPQTRPLSDQEAHRLAQMPRVNFDEAGVAVRATIGGPDSQVRATGWVDWQHPVAYLAVSGPRPDVRATLVQVVPGLVATRPAPPPPTPPPGSSPLVDPFPAPPHQPPQQGWQVRPVGSLGTAETADSPAVVDAVAMLLLAVAAEQPSSTQVIAGSDSRWLRRDRTAGYEVDVVLGPVAPPVAPAGPSDAGWSLADMGGAVQYWLDEHARLHRFDALLANDLPVRVEFDRGAQAAVQVIDLLGGGRVDPRRPTEQEAQTLAQLRQRNHASRGSALHLSAVTQEATVRAVGWLDWQHPAAYVAVHADDPAASGLIWASPDDVATWLGPTAANGDAEAAAPPAAPPPGTAADWRWQSWQQRGHVHDERALELLLSEVLSLTSRHRDDAAWLRTHAYWLRDTELGGHPVTVFEIPGDDEITPGTAALRYWVGQETGLLHRLEVRTRTGTFAQLDVRGGALPASGLVAPPR